MAAITCILRVMISILPILATDVSARDNSILELRGDDGRAILRADTQRFAGAIYSFSWNGAEFLDRHDHGRLLQSALFLDNLGPCYNPTEAGSQWDSTGPKSSSRLETAKVNKNILSTKVDAAFWLKPGMAVSGSRGCGWGARPDKKVAANLSITDKYYISKAVSFDTDTNWKQSLKYSTQYSLPKSHDVAKFDVVAVYLRGVFSVVEQLQAGRAVPLNTSKTYDTLNKPVIISTTDGRYALSVVCSFSDPIYQFNLYNAANTNAVHCMKELQQPREGIYSFDARVLFGSRDDVINMLQRLNE